MGNKAEALLRILKGDVRGAFSYVVKTKEGVEVKKILPSQVREALLSRVEQDKRKPREAPKNT